MQKILNLVLVLIVIIFGLIVLGVQSELSKGDSLGSAEFNTFTTPDTQSVVSVGASVSTEVAATNTARQYLEVSNIGGGQVAYCKWGGGAATKGSGFALFGSTTRTFGPDMNIQGELNCIFNTSTSSITVIEK